MYFWSNKSYIHSSIFIQVKCCWNWLHRCNKWIIRLPQANDCRCCYIQLHLNLQSSFLHSSKYYTHFCTDKTRNKSFLTFFLKLWEHYQVESNTVLTQYNVSIFINPEWIKVASVGTLVLGFGWLLNKLSNYRIHQCTGCEVSSRCIFYYVSEMDFFPRET